MFFYKEILSTKRWLIYYLKSRFVIFCLKPNLVSPDVKSYIIVTNCDWLYNIGGDENYKSLKELQLF